MPFFEQHSNDLRWTGNDEEAIEAAYNQKKELFNRLRQQKEPLYTRLFTVFSAYHHEIIRPRRNYSLEAQRTSTLILHPHSPLVIEPARYCFSQTVFDPSHHPPKEPPRGGQHQFFEGKRTEYDDITAFSRADVIQCVVTMSPSYDYEQKLHREDLDLCAYFKVWRISNFDLNNACYDELEQSFPGITISSYNSYLHDCYCVTLPKAETPDQIQHYAQQTLPYLTNFVLNH